MKILPWKIAPQWIFFMIFILISNCYFSIIFFLCVYFWFSGMAYVYHTYMRDQHNTGHRYLVSQANCREVSLTLWGSYNTSTHKSNFLFFFRKNCRQIVNYNLSPLIPKEKYPQKIALVETPLSENCLQGIKLPFRKFRLHFRPNMIRQLKGVTYC